MKENTNTSHLKTNTNIEHSTPNVERRTEEAKGTDGRRFLSLFDFLRFDVGRSAFDVRCSMFAFSSDTSLDFALNCEYITATEHQQLSEANHSIGRMLGSMINHPEPFLIKP